MNTCITSKSFSISCPNLCLILILILNLNSNPTNNKTSPAKWKNAVTLEDFTQLSTLVRTHLWTVAVICIVFNQSIDLNFILTTAALCVRTTLLPCAPNITHPNHSERTATVAFPAPLMPSMSARKLQLQKLKVPDAIFSSCVRIYFLNKRKGFVEKHFI